MTKKIVFDMDGTIADFYNVPNWLEMLDNEDTTPYEIAKPMYNMAELTGLLKILQVLGFEIAVVTWLSKNADKDFKKRIRKSKKDWLKKYDFPCDEFHGVQYGTPKHTVIKADRKILIDDNENVRKKWTGDTIDANKNIITALQKIIFKEISEKGLTSRSECGII